jgi:hypothetical protein
MAYTTINKGSSYFNTVLYAGNNGASQSITGVGFQPDFVWIKNRTDARNHVLTDIIRGATKTLFSQSDIAEVTNPTDGYLSSFGSDGFSVSQGSIGNENVCATDNYVSWNWLANGAGVSNTAGTISSTVSANTTSGFSVVTYTGTGSAATVGHGLGVAPSMIFLKIRSATDAWIVYSKSLGNTKIMVLNSTAAEQTRADWNNTSPTSSVFSIGTFSNENTNAATYVAYCFAEVKGFSKFGSYTGNGSSNGTFVYTGFKPAFVMTKQTSGGGGNWFIVDNKRNTFNVVNNLLDANLSDAERNANIYDFCSNGFKDRLGLGSGETFIYMAFAENPFVSSTLIPTTAR